MKQAVIYIRVSTPGQANRDHDPEGYSIPAQRDACTNKAKSLEASVVAEFVDAGESARSVDRTQLQAMLKYLKETKGIDYVIVHKVDRLARSREDDVAISLAIHKAGAILVSVTENIDETPSGRLVHGIMASIADFYSGNLSLEVVKGMVQKAKSGGTLNRPPLGYINRREFVYGHDSRWVEIDEERADLVRMAFGLYATGEYSLVRLAELLTEKGLTSRPTKRLAAHGMTKNTIATMLANPYYMGITKYQGVEYPGKHEALISPAIFRQVQDVLKARLAGEKQRTYMHYLKGTVYCGRCASRMCIAYQKQQYMYYFCLGRKKRNGCKLPYFSVDDIEEKIAKYYRYVKLTESEAERVRAEVKTYVQENSVDIEMEAKRQRLALERLEAEHTKLLEAYYAGFMPLAKFGQEQERIANATEVAGEALASAELGFDDVEVKLEDVLHLMLNWHETYQKAPKQLRRKLNQAFFSYIYVSDNDDGVSINGAQLAEPFGAIMALSGRPRIELERL
jgi:site-specific DNA recombinase